MRPRDSDSVFQTHQFGEHFGARNDWNFQEMRFDNFRIVAADRGADHQDVCSSDVFRAMPFVNCRAEICEAVGDR